MPKKTPDQRERPPQPELTVRRLGEKPPMIVFEGQTREICFAYNTAILEISKREGLKPFHQITATGKDVHGPGLHGWEFWAGADESRLEGLFQEIHERAQELIERYAGR